MVALAAPRRIDASSQRWRHRRTATARRTIRASADVVTAQRLRASAAGRLLLHRALVLARHVEFARWSIGCALPCCARRPYSAKSNSEVRARSLAVRLPVASPSRSVTRALCCVRPSSLCRVLARIRRVSISAVRNVQRPLGACQHGGNPLMCSCSPFRCPTRERQRRAQVFE